MSIHLRSFIVASALIAASLSPAADATEEAEKEAILALISRMEAAWNRGDFRGYMEGFANPDVVFVSRGQFQKDWQGTLDRPQNPQDGINTRLMRRRDGKWVIALNHVSSREVPCSDAKAH